MKLLLDAHVFLWLNLEPEKCTPKVLDLCQQPETVLLLSMASIWEIQIKHQLGKLPLTVALRTLIETSQAEYEYAREPVKGNWKTKWGSQYQNIIDSVYVSFEVA